MIVIGLVLLAGTLNGVPAGVTLIESDRGRLRGESHIQVMSRNR